MKLLVLLALVAIASAVPAPALPKSFTAKASSEADGMKMVADIKVDGPNKRAYVKAGMMGMTMLGMVAKQGKQYSYAMNQCEIKDMTPEEMDVFDIQKYLDKATFVASEVIDGVTLFKWDVMGQVSIWCDDKGVVRQVGMMNQVSKLSEIVETTFTDADFEVPAEWKCPGVTPAPDTPVPEPGQPTAEPVRPVIPNSFTAKASGESSGMKIAAELKLDGPNKRGSIKAGLMGMTVFGMIAKQGKQYSYVMNQCDVKDMTPEEIDVFDFQKYLLMATFDKTEVIDGVTLFKWDVMGQASFWCDDKGVVRQVGMMGQVTKFSDIVETTFTDADFEVPAEWKCAGVTPVPETPVPAPVVPTVEPVRPVIPNSFTAKASGESSGMKIAAEVKLDGPNKRAFMKAGAMGMTVLGMIAKQGKQYSYVMNQCDVKDMTPEEIDVFDFQKYLLMATFDKTEVIDGVTLFKWDVMGQVSIWCDDKGVVRQSSTMGQVSKFSEIVETTFTDADFEVPAEWKCAGVTPVPETPVPEPVVPTGEPVRPVIPNSFTAKASGESSGMKIAAELKLDGPNKRASIKSGLMGMTVLGMIAKQGKQYSYFMNQCDVKDMTPEEIDVFDFQKYLLMATFDKTEVIDGVTLFKWDIMGQASFWCDDKGVVRQMSMMGQVTKLSEIVETTFTDADFEVPAEWNCAAAPVPPVPAPVNAGPVHPRIPNSFTAKAKVNFMEKQMTAEIKLDGPNKRASMKADVPEIGMVAKQGKMSLYFMNQCEVKDMSPEVIQVFDFKKYLQMAVFDKLEVIDGDSLFKWDVMGQISVWCDYMGMVRQVGVGGQVTKVLEIVEATFTDADFVVPEAWKCQPANALTLRRAAPKSTPMLTVFGLAI